MARLTLNELRSIIKDVIISEASFSTRGRSKKQFLDLLSAEEMLQHVKDVASEIQSEGITVTDSNENSIARRFYPQFEGFTQAMRDTGLHNSSEVLAASMANSISGFPDIDDAFAIIKRREIKPIIAALKPIFNSRRD